MLITAPEKKKEKEHKTNKTCVIYVTNLRYRHSQVIQSNILFKGIRFPSTYQFNLASTITIRNQVSSPTDPERMRIESIRRKPGETNGLFYNNRKRISRYRSPIRQDE